MPQTRCPLIVILGHVDHGKTTLLDKIRGTAVQTKEAKGLTQHIGASELPVSVIRDICGPLTPKLSIPGLLFIDTPGHESFTNLRKRGGSIADLAILVVNINDGFMPQTVEAVRILKEFKVPFVVAATKIDVISGWMPQKTNSFLESYAKQKPRTKELFENKFYELVEQLSNHDFEGERFDQVTDFTKQVSIIPCSGKTGEGLAELLAVLSGLAQKFLEQKLGISVDGPGKGNVLEVKQTTGLGTTIDAVIYDGNMREGDTIVIGGLKEPIVTKIKALLKPAPLQETRVTGDFKKVKEVSAAVGVKISASGLDEVIAGMPLRVVRDNNLLDDVKAAVQKEVSNVTVETDEEGIILRADTLGSLEALISLLRKDDIKIRKALIGNITKKDVFEANELGKEKPVYGVVLGFNVKPLPEALSLATELKVKLLLDNVIYGLLDNYKAWVAEQIDAKKKAEFNKLTKPGKLRILPGHVFRQSNPAVVGIEVLAGKIVSGVELLSEDGRVVGRVKELQDQGENIPEVSTGNKVACSITRVTVGRGGVDENTVLWSDVKEEDFRIFKTKFADLLTEPEKDVLKEIASIHRKRNSLWGLG